VAGFLASPSTLTLIDAFLARIAREAAGIGSAKPTGQGR